MSGALAPQAEPDPAPRTALPGLLLIGWSASCTCIAMERFWTQTDRPM